jgi:hypothetical protein
MLIATRKTRISCHARTAYEIVIRVTIKYSRYTRDHSSPCIRRWDRCCSNITGQFVSENERERQSASTWVKILVSQVDTPPAREPSSLTASMRQRAWEIGGELIAQRARQHIDLVPWTASKSGTGLDYEHVSQWAGQWARQRESKIESTSARERERATQRAHQTTS